MRRSHGSYLTMDVDWLVVWVGRFDFVCDPCFCVGIWICWLITQSIVEHSLSDFCFFWNTHSSLYFHNKEKITEVVWFVAVLIAVSWNIVFWMLLYGRRRLEEYHMQLSAMEKLKKQFCVLKLSQFLYKSIHLIFFTQI